jgi:hypothetical protein
MALAIGGTRLAPSSLRGFLEARRRLASDMAARKSGKRVTTGKKRYGKKAAEKVERAMHEMKRGTLRSGSSGRKVTTREQAIAIGLSEARKAGGKVSRPRSRKSD